MISRSRGAIYGSVPPRSGSTTDSSGRKPHLAPLSSRAQRRFNLFGALPTHPLGEAPPQSLFVLLDHGGDAADEISAFARADNRGARNGNSGAEPRGCGFDQRERSICDEWIRRALPRLNWRSHLFLLSRDRPLQPETFERLTAPIVSFLKSQGLATVHLHPVIALAPGHTGQRQSWRRLLAPTEPFQASAYQEQSEMRLLLLPLLVASPEVSTDDIERAADFFVERAARPSFYLAREPEPRLVRKADDEGIRLYVGPPGKASFDQVVEQLLVNHIFDALLLLVEDDEAELLAPCPAHLVVDAALGRVFGCLRRWKRGKDGVCLDTAATGELGLPDPVPPDLCATCIGRSLLSMRPNIDANQRRKEGGRVLFRVGGALSRQGEHALAAELSGHAVELCDRDQDRGSALVQQGLCLLAQGEHERADQALQKANAYPVDPGAVAVYRGRVQLELRDYIEALDRFAEALELGCQQTPREDICFEMALCHINIEEYAEARPWLEQSLKPGQEKAPVSFYRGICELGQGRALEALDHFQEALRIGPADEDLSRVLFYVGNCFKQLERFPEAIEALERAVAADPNELANHNLLGFCYYKTKEHDKAVECFRRAVEIDPRSGIDWANLGSNLRDLGRIDQAVAMYRKALSLDPTLDFARDNLSRLTGNDPSS